MKRAILILVGVALVSAFVQQQWAALAALLRAKIYDRRPPARTIVVGTA
ncbi:MAG TPA: hypothetical protein VF807_03305 [Ktedonobacterales bacterium]